MKVKDRFMNRDVEDNRELVSTDPVTFPVLFNRAEEIRKKCSDYTVTGANDSNFRLNSSGGITYQSDDGSIHYRQISRFALGQLCSKIGVPAQYIEKCVQSGRLDLAQDNVQSWLSEYNKDLFIREYAGSIRGVLTPRFSVCDAPDILGVLEDTIGSLRIRGSYITPDRLHLRLTDSSKLPVDGEDLYAGLMVDSSDVGRSTLSVHFMLYKQVCTNGLCVSRGSGILFQQKHIGISSEQFKREFEHNLHVFPELTHSIVASIEEMRNSGRVVEDFEDEKEIQNIIDKLQRGGMSAAQSKDVIQLFRKRVEGKEDFNYENNRWGLINAITEVSKKVTLEQRIEYEKYAGRLLVA